MSEIYKKKRKVRFCACYFKNAQICFNEPDYVTVHSVMNTMTANGAKMADKNDAIMFLTYYYLLLVGKGLLQAHNDKCYSLVELLCICFC